MFARFFIDRPIFAAVLSILITLGGLVGLTRLPVALYPEITPPTVEVSTIYPGAHSRTIADTVAAPIEEQVNGVEGMMYMTSTSGNDGSYALTVTFRPGTDLNIAQVLVQNRVNIAAPKLPQEVRRRGVTVKKKSTGILMIVNLSESEAPTDPNAPSMPRSNLYLSNYATIQLRDELARLEGVGDIVFLGQRDYSMRVWLDPDQLSARGLSAEQVTHAIEQQNAQVAAGQIGQPPVPTGQAFQYTINTRGRLLDPEQFREIVLKTDEEGRTVRMKDVTSSIAFGAVVYDQTCTLDGKPSVALSIYQLPGSNAIETANRVKAKMRELRPRFPMGIDYSIVYDTTPFIEESVGEVFLTLRDAVLLVALVMLVFLQSWRSAIIPMAAVPVAIIGTFGAMALFGYSLNTLTLFGLVLAVGIVVDDAIVVVEAAEYHLARGLSPRDATVEAMNQVAGPVIAVGLVLAAVFVPCLFITGIIGQFFQQFAVTIAISTLLSAFNSLTLSPALCALLLKPHEHGKPEPLPRIAIPLLLAGTAYFFLTPYLRPILDSWTQQIPADWPQRAALIRWIPGVLTVLVAFAIGYVLRILINRSLGIGFRWFNKLFDWATAGYLKIVRVLLWISPLVLLGYGGLIYATQLMLTQAPVGFIPPQDKGYLIVNIQLPQAAALNVTEGVTQRVEALAREIPGVRNTVAVAGQSALLGGNASNFATVYVMLAPFEERHGSHLGADAIATVLRNRCEERIWNAEITVLGAPPVDGLGAAGGFRIMIEDRNKNEDSDDSLQRVGELVAGDAAAAAELRGVFAGFRSDTPWIELQLNRHQAESTGVAIDDIIKTLQKYFGSEYVNDFNRFGRTWQVTVQADEKFRRLMKDLKRLQVQNRQQEMVPIGGFLEEKDDVGPVMVVRYNLHPVSPVTASPAPGVSSGQAIAKLEAIANQHLENGMKAEWTELALLQLESGDTALWAFLLSVVLVFLVLAAQYESWALPFAVILVVPLCLLSAVIGVQIAGHDVNIFTQIGFVVLVGLACKNAILIVEFARNRHSQGASIREATLEACKLRLRPIVMTSVAFIFGVVPLVLAEGAGGEMRSMLGTAVFAGMIGVTLFGVFLTPVFFFVIQWLSDRLRGTPTRAG
jgi:multidrug efflux pump